MTDRFAKKKRSEIMSKIKSKDTKPEKTVRKLLHGLGFRYRLHVSDLPGKPDIVLPKFKTVIFVNGCFWHGHKCRRGHTPLSNLDYWEPKVKRNIERDKKNKAKLRRLGWRVITVWECETTDMTRLRKKMRSLISVKDEKGNIT